MKIPPIWPHFTLRGKENDFVKRRFVEKRNKIVFSGIEGVYVIADDMIVAAKNEKEHDTIMLSLPNRAKEKVICFNRDMIQFKVNSVSYMEYLVVEDGLKPDDEKINAIANMPPHLTDFLYSAYLE